jgi:protein involved in polysaccharide export with SLBB domain
MKQIVSGLILLPLACASWAAAPATQPQLGEVFIGGDVKRTGVYALSPARSLSLKQLIVTAGIERGTEQDDFLTLQRRNEGHEVIVYRNLQLARLFDGAEADVALEPNDQVMVMTRKAVDAAEAEQRRSGRIEPHDRVRVTVKELTAPNTNTEYTVRVDPQGRIRLPLVGKVSIAQQTLKRAGDTIDQAYTNANVERDPGVTVVFDETGSHLSTQFAPLKVGDHVDLSVWSLTGPGVETHVSPTIGDDGVIHPPMIGDIKVVGMTEAEVEIVIADAYRNAQLLTLPIVIVRRVAAELASKSQ